MEQNNETIGDRIRGLRTSKKLSTNAVADITGISTGNLNEIENGKVEPGAKNLIKLSRFYGVTTDWILTGEVNGPDNVSESKAVYTCEVKMVLPDPSNELVEDLNFIRDVLEHGDPKPKAWLEGQIKWTVWKLKNW